MGVSPSVGQLGPDAVKASRFEQSPEGENALATGAAPSLAATLEPGVDDHFVRRLDSAAADGRAGIAGRFVTHPLAVTADIPNGGGDLASPWAFPLEISQRIDHLAHALGILCQDRLVCIEPRRAPGALRANRGINRGLERGAGLPDIDPPDIRGQTLQKGPVVPGPIGDGDNLQLLTLRRRLRHPVPHLLADLAFQTGLARFGKPGKSALCEHRPFTVEWGHNTAGGHASPVPWPVHQALPQASAASCHPVRPAGPPHHHAGSHRPAPL